MWGSPTRHRTPEGSPGLALAVFHEAVRRTNPVRLSSRHRTLASLLACGSCQYWFRAYVDDLVRQRS